MDEIESPKLPPKTVDRVTLGKNEVEKLSQWLKQLEESSQGFLHLSRADLVNFLIGEHKAQLSPREMQQIRTRNYDPIKHLNWITPRLKEALEKRDFPAVSVLQAEIRGIELSVITKAMESSPISGEFDPPTRPRRKRIKKSTGPLGSPSLAELQTDLPEG